VSFTLRHTARADILALVRARSDRRRAGEMIDRTPLRARREHAEDASHVPRACTLRPEALMSLIERDPGFSEWPVKRPVAMTVVVRAEAGRGRRGPRVVGFRRGFSRHQVLEVTGVRRDGDTLVQDNYTCGWETVAGAGERWRIADLEGAVLSVRAVYLSFDDINFRYPPRFDRLDLHFGDTTPGVLGFTEDQLAAPLVYEDPAPLLRGSFFKTLVLGYSFALTPALLAAQLSFEAPPQHNVVPLFRGPH
jgi:hypothetical protein